jgi:hypothetical protein
MNFNSSKYWEKRYASGNTSGDGSYGHLAKFKAEIINNIIKKYDIKSVVDYGVGDGNQCNLINTTNISYYGIDISKTAINLCCNKFQDNKTFMLVDDFINTNTRCELSISCDVIYHLIEKDIYQNYMKNLCNFSNRYILIYARDEDINHAEHVKFRKFSNFMNKTQYELLEHIPNPYPQYQLGYNNKNTSPSDFYFYLLK